VSSAETNRAKIIRRLEAEGWKNEGGKNYDKYTKSGMKVPILLPRHRTLSVGVARSIARAAEW
jgi:hypothetical protein